MTTRHRRGERGAALVAALMALLLLTALGLALVLTTTTETRIAGNYSAGVEALYAADAALEMSLGDLLTVVDWSTLLAGEVTSSFTDGPPSGVRVLRDGSRLDLTEAANMANCGKILRCSVADMNAATDDRPWGDNNPRWRPFAYGPLAKLVPAGTVTSNMYVIVWVGDDQSESDNNPLEDGDMDGAGVLVVRAEAFGPNAVHKAIEATLARSTGDPEDEPHNVGPIRVRVLSWREIR